jgi:hypothetical protein
MTSRRSLHDNDFYAWSLEQAALLRAGRVGEADLATIAEEIESMGKTEKRELVSRLTVLLLHLLKWERQPAGRSNSWRLSNRKRARRNRGPPGRQSKPEAHCRRRDGLRLSLRASQSGDRDGYG